MAGPGGTPISAALRVRGCQEPAVGKGADQRPYRVGGVEPIPVAQCGAAADHARLRVEPSRRRRTALSGSVRPRRPGMGVDRLLRPRPAPGTPAPATQLKSASRRALPCPAVSVTVPTKIRRCTPGDRHFADQAVTSPTTPPISVFIHDEAINGKTNDGQQTAPITVSQAA